MGEQNKIVPLRQRLRIVDSSEPIAGVLCLREDASGRGPAWLRRLVVWAAGRLGMTSRARLRRELARVTYTETLTSDLPQSLAAAVLDACDTYDVPPSQMLVLIGTEQMKSLAATDHRGALEFRASSPYLRWGYARGDWHQEEPATWCETPVDRWGGVDVVAVPSMRGLLVLPKIHILRSETK